MRFHRAGHVPVAVRGCPGGHSGVFEISLAAGGCFSRRRTHWLWEWMTNWKSDSSATVQGRGRRRRLSTQGDEVVHSENMGSNKTRAGSSYRAATTRGNLTVKLLVYVSKVQCGSIWNPWTHRVPQPCRLGTWLRIHRGRTYARVGFDALGRKCERRTRSNVVTLGEKSRWQAERRWTRRPSMGFEIRDEKDWHDVLIESAAPQGVEVSVAYFYPSNDKYSYMQRLRSNQAHQVNHNQNTLVYARSQCRLRDHKYSTVSREQLFVTKETVIGLNSTWCEKNRRQYSLASPRFDNTHRTPMSRKGIRRIEQK